MKKIISIFLVFCATCISSEAKDLVVWSAGAVQAAVEELAPEFQRQTGTSLQIQYAPVGAWMRRLAAGEHADVMILTSDVLPEVDAKGWSMPTSAKPLGRVGVGVAVKQGASIPDISTPAALRETLLQAKSITYMDPQKGTSGKHFAGVLEKLEIFDQVKSKTTLGDAGYVLEPVARGEVEIGIQQITEILPVHGAQLVGPLPPSLQKITTYTVVIGAQTHDAVTAEKFSQFLQSAQAKSIFERKGFMVQR